MELPDISTLAQDTQTLIDLDDKHFEALEDFELMEVMTILMTLRRSLAPLMENIPKIMAKVTAELDRRNNAASQTQDKAAQLPQLPQGDSPAPPEQAAKA